jgi:hypothetical protein
VVLQRQWHLPIMPIIRCQQGMGSLEAAQQQYLSQWQPLAPLHLLLLTKHLQIWCSVTSASVEPCCHRQTHGQMMGSGWELLALHLGKRSCPSAFSESWNEFQCQVKHVSSDLHFKPLQCQPLR